MARGINKAIIIGNLGRDPETRYTASGMAVTNIAVATSESWKDKESGQMQEKTEWHRVVMYGKVAEIASEYLKKGAKVYIEGKLRTSKWQDKTTQVEKSVTEIVCSEMQILESKNSSSQKENREPIFPDKNGNDKSDSFDDDIPF